MASKQLGYIACARMASCISRSSEAAGQQVGARLDAGREEADEFAIGFAVFLNSSVDWSAAETARAPVIWRISSSS